MAGCLCDSIGRLQKRAIRVVAGQHQGCGYGQWLCVLQHGTASNRRKLQHGDNGAGGRTNGLCGYSLLFLQGRSNGNKDFLYLGGLGGKLFYLYSRARSRCGGCHAALRGVLRRAVFVSAYGRGATRLRDTHVQVHAGAALRRIAYHAQTRALYRESAVLRPRRD